MHMSMQMLMLPTLIFSNKCDRFMKYVALLMQSQFIVATVKTANLRMESNFTNVSNLNPLKVSLGQVQVVFITVWCLIALSTIIGACIILGLCYHERKLSKISHKHIISMATADLLQGLLNAPVSIFLSFDVKINDKMCFEALIMGITAVFLTMFILVSMSIDRYIAIVHPLYYKTNMTGTKANCKSHRSWSLFKYYRDSLVLGMILSSWCIGAIIGLMVYLSENAATDPDALCFVYTERTDKFLIMFVSTFIIAPCNLIFICIYVKIYKVITDSMGQTTSRKDKWKQLGKIVRRQSTFNNSEKLIFGKLTAREIRTTVLLFVTVVLFLLTWIPGIILVTMLTYFPDHVSVAGMLTVYTLSQVNSVINPFLYAGMIKNSGIIIKNWFKCFYC